MSIQEHKWSDSEGLSAQIVGDHIQFDFDAGSVIDQDKYIHFDKDDAIAIAKHFNQDRESLVLKIKEVIDEYKCFSGADLDLLDKLLEITKEEIKCL